jgi:hypothetical protein
MPRPAPVTLEVERRSLPPVPKVRLDSPKRVRLELSKLYAEAKRGLIEPAVATRLAYILDLIRRSFELEAGQAPPGKATAIELEWGDRVVSFDWKALIRSHPTAPGSDAHAAPAPLAADEADVVVVSTDAVDALAAAEPAAQAPLPVPPVMSERKSLLWREPMARNASFTVPKNL